jgi:HEAT repeat protein
MGSKGAGIMDHLRGRLGLLVIAVAATLAACPMTLAQQDADQVLNEAIDQAKDPSSSVRGMALQTLGSLGGGDARTPPVLVAVLQDPVPANRAQAATILGALRPAAIAGLPALTAALEDPEGNVREAAARSLAQFGSKARGSIDALVRSLRAAPDRRCPAAVGTLACIGRPAMPALIGLLKSDDQTLRRTVLDGLTEAAQSGLWNHQRAVSQALEPLYSSLAGDPDPAVRIALARMLLAVESDSPLVRRTFRDLLLSSDGELRLAVVKLVSSATYPAVVPLGPLLDLLKDGDGQVRMAAARAIRQEDLQAKDVVDRLLSALKDPDADVRAAAVQKLAEDLTQQETTGEQGRPVYQIATSSPITGHPIAGEALRVALSDSQSRVRAAAARLLAVFPAEADRSIPLLIERLKDPAASVRASAAEALSQFAPKAKAAIRPLLAILVDPNDRPEEGRFASLYAARALLTIGGACKTKMVHLLLGQLNALDDAVREHASRILVGLGPRIVDDLLEALSDRRLARQVHVEVQSALQGILSQHGGSVRIPKSAPRTRAAVPTLRSLARDSDQSIQLTALSLLATIAPEVDDAADVYVDLLRKGETPGLDDPMPGILGADRQDEWLGVVRRPAMIPRLIRALREEDDTTRLATLHVLLSMAEDLPETEGGGVKEQLAQALLVCVRDPDGRVRWLATETLGVLHVEAKTVVPILVEMVKTEKGRVPPDDDAIRSFQQAEQPYVLGPNKKGDPLRIAAIQALGGFGTEAAEAVPELIAALRDEDRRVRWFAAEALGLVGPEAKAAVPALVEAFRSLEVVTADQGANVESIRKAPIRLIAAFALGKIGPAARAAIPDLTAALSGPDSRVRGAAARALGLIGPDARQAVPHLIRLVAHSVADDVKGCAKEALTRLKAEALPSLIQALHDGEPVIRLAAVEVFMFINFEDKTAVPLNELARCLADPVADVRRDAFAILAQLNHDPGAARAIPRLVIALGDEDLEVADAAGNALAVIVKPHVCAYLPVLNIAVAGFMGIGEPFHAMMIPAAP